MRAKFVYGQTGIHAAVRVGRDGAREECGERRGKLYNTVMTAQVLKDLVKRAETWPPELQEELAEIARELDSAFRGGVYHATPEELAGIDRGLEDARAGRFATDEEVAAVFAKYRPA